MQPTSSGSQLQEKIQEMMDNFPELSASEAAAKVLESQPNQPVDVTALIKTIMENLPKQSGSIDALELAKAIKKDDKGEMHQSHGLTQNEMKEVKLAQMQGKVKMIKANNNSRFEIPEHEKGLIHFSTENVTYKTNTDEKTSTPRYHVKTVEDFERMSQTVRKPGQKTNPENALAGLRVVILHDPRKGSEKAAKIEVFSREEVLSNMTEEAVRREYLRVFEEDALPSDSKKIMIQMILEKEAD